MAVKISRKRGSSSVLGGWVGKFLGSGAVGFMRIGRHLRRFAGLLSPLNVAGRGRSSLSISNPAVRVLDALLSVEISSFRINQFRNL